MIEDERSSRRKLVKNIRENLFAQIDKLVQEAEAELRSMNQK